MEHKIPRFLCKVKNRGTDYPQLFRVAAAEVADAQNTLQFLAGDRGIGAEGEFARLTGQQRKAVVAEHRRDSAQFGEDEERGELRAQFQMPDAVALFDAVLNSGFAEVAVLVLREEVVVVMAVRFSASGDFEFEVCKDLVRCGREFGNARFLNLDRFESRRNRKPKVSACL